MLLLSRVGLGSYDVRMGYVPPTQTLLLAIEQRLRMVGLLVGTPDPEEIALISERGHWPYAARFWIAKPSADPECRSFFGSEKHPFTDAVAHLDVFIDQPYWFFQIHQYIPGPGETDFRHPYPDSVNALAAIEAFYFGAPTMIAGWPIPLHRFPPWQSHADQIQRIVARAHTRTAEHLANYERRLYDRMRARLPANHDPYDRVAALFVPITHPTNPRWMLHVRRDLGEAILVSRDPADP